MDIKAQLTEAMKQAMRANDDVARRTTRMALAAVKQAEVDKRISLDDAAVIALLQKEIKNRREALEDLSGHVLPTIKATVDDPLNPIMQRHKHYSNRQRREDDGNIGFLPGHGRYQLLQKRHAAEIKEREHCRERRIDEGAARKEDGH